MLAKTGGKTRDVKFWFSAIKCSLRERKIKIKISKAKQRIDFILAQSGQRFFYIYYYIITIIIILNQLKWKVRWNLFHGILFFFLSPKHDNEMNVSSDADLFIGHNWMKLRWRGAKKQRRKKKEQTKEKICQFWQTPFHQMESISNFSNTRKTNTIETKWAIWGE